MRSEYRMRTLANRIVLTAIEFLLQKLEQTVAGNARLEQELLVLRQKLQATRGSRGSLNALAVGQMSDSYAGSSSAVLESGKEEKKLYSY